MARFTDALLIDFQINAYNLIIIPDWCKLQVAMPQRSGDRDQYCSYHARFAAKFVSAIFFFICNLFTKVMLAIVAN